MVKFAYGRKTGERGRTLLAVLLLFFAFSFLGWCMEKLFFLIAYGVNADRGFLKLPFCTIYGGSLAVVRLMFGLPLQKNLRYPFNLLSFLLYALGAALVATAAELFTGVFFDKIFGVRLWTYRGYPHEFGGYICLPMSVTWGALIAFAMSALWTPLERAAVKLPVSALAWSGGLLSLALSLDFLLCLAALIA